MKLCSSKINVKAMQKIECFKESYVQIFGLNNRCEMRSMFENAFGFKKYYMYLVQAFYIYPFFLINCALKVLVSCI